MRARTRAGAVGLISILAAVGGVAGFAAAAAAATKTAPVISSFSPRSGGIGSRIDIRGSDFIGVRKVEIGGAPSDFSVRSTKRIVATVPVAASSGRVTVATRSGVARSAGTFRVRPSLQLSASAGPPDTPIQVWGLALRERRGSPSSSLRPG
jgi:hypothetical protein